MVPNLLGAHFDVDVPDARRVSCGKTMEMGPNFDVGFLTNGGFFSSSVGIGVSKDDQHEGVGES